MNIQQFGGEFKLINAIVKKVKDQKNVIKGPGDDCSVVDLGNKYQLISTDMFTDGDHFSTKYFKPIEIGAKVMEASLSDIAAMGGKALYAYLCISLKPDMSVASVRSLFRGVYNSCNNYNVSLLGGDITKSNKMTISVTVVGETTKENLCLREHAQENDIIKVTGELGASTAGFNILKRKFIGHTAAKKKTFRTQM